MTGSSPNGSPAQHARRSNPDFSLVTQCANTNPFTVNYSNGASRVPRSQSHIELPAPVDVLGLPLRPLDMHGLISTVVQRAQKGARTLGMYANAHTMNLAAGNLRFHRTLAECDLLYADGASVVWASRLARKSNPDRRILPQRMTAADYFPRMVEACANAGVSIYLLGSRPGISDTAVRVLKSRFPALAIVGTHHGHFDLNESSRIIDAINAASPDILFVGMSSPRQEFWLAEHASRLNPPVRWCVGALFDYLAGLEPRGPAWLCDHGGEWLARLLADPRGKWKRYLLGNPKFVWQVLRRHYLDQWSGRPSVMHEPAISS